MKTTTMSRAVATAIVGVLPFIFGTVAAPVAHAQAVQNTTFNYLYDAMGNLTQVTDPLGRVSNQTVDALSRVTQQLQPAATTGSARPTINYTYDLQHQTATVTDPRNLATTYTTSGLEDQTYLSSPDSGGTTRVFDSSGRIVQLTDARGKITSFQYDVLGRKTREDYANGTPTAFEYDGGPSGAANAIGRLTKITDESGQTAYSYDQAGRVLSKVQSTTLPSLQTLIRTVSYSYDSSGRPATTTYPSGTRVSYVYDTAGQVARITFNPPDELGNTNLATEVVILDQIAYSPFGPVQSWAWGNSTPTALNQYARTFDLDGRITSYPLGNVAAGNGGMTRTLTYDAAGNITAFAHSGMPTASTFDQSFAYDGLNRLINFTASSSTQSYSYDISGNRTQIAFSGAPYANTISVTSNRLSSTSGPVPAKINTFDAAGNLKSDGTISFTYSSRGRLSNVVNGSVSASYLYNGLGERVLKASALVSTGASAFVYDQAGHLIGEYDASGKVVNETVYLGDVPVAVLVSNVANPAVASSIVYYIYPDQLNAPRLISNSSTGNIVWRWDSADPFGIAPPEQTSGLDGPLTFNQRLPGQYFDKETNLNYNYFRDYDPQTGRYVQSDPIGLEGGINTYAYVGGNPLIKADPNGLDGIFVNYIGYQAAITKDISLPVGHAGVIAINRSNGATAYYDFGRYGSKYGDIRGPFDVGTVKFDKNGNPTQESVEKVVTNASNAYGKGYSPYYQYSRKPYKDIVDYANKRRAQAQNGTRPYNFVFDNCKNFGREAAGPGLGNLPR